MAAQPSSWTLKAELDGDVRRLRPWPAEGCEPSEASVRNAVGQLFGLSAGEAGLLRMRYKDDEGDLCTLSEPSLPDALSLALKPANVLRIWCDRPATEEAHSAPAEPAVQEAPVAAGPEPKLRHTATALFGRLSQLVLQDARELKAAVEEPNGLQNLSQTLRDRLSERAEEARAAANEVRAAASQARSQGDVKAAVGIAAAAVVPAALVVLAPGRCARLGLLAAGATAVSAAAASVRGAMASDLSAAPEPTAEPAQPTVPQQPEAGDSEPAQPTVPQQQPEAGDGEPAGADVGPHPKSD